MLLNMKLKNYIVYVAFFTAFLVQADEEGSRPQAHPVIQKMNEWSKNDQVNVEQLYPKYMKYPFEYIDCIDVKKELDYQIYINARYIRIDTCKLNGDVLQKYNYKRNIDEQIVSVKQLVDQIGAQIKLPKHLEIDQVVFRSSSIMEIYLYDKSAYDSRPERGDIVKKYEWRHHQWNLIEDSIITW